MIVEMRTYTVKRGTRPKILEVLKGKTFDELKRIGVKCWGPCASTEDETTIFWMRGFPDEASRGTMSSQFYGGAAWKNELADAFMPNLEKYEVVAVEMAEGAVKWV